MKLIKIAKFVLPNSTYTCGYCSSNLSITDVTNNPKHLYNPGQLFSCSCGKSQVWANSVREFNDLENYCDGKPVTGYNPEVYGFCNDKYCPKCFGYFGPAFSQKIVLDGVEISKDEFSALEVDERRNAQWLDVHCCKNDCGSGNDFVIHHGTRSEGGEDDGQKTIAQWFRSNQHMWRNTK
jgi:hypothetical protein